MAGGIHEKKKRWTHSFVASVLLLVVFVSYEIPQPGEGKQFDIEDNTDFHCFVGSYAKHRRTPDMSVVNRSVNGFDQTRNYMPVFVMEGAVSQDYEDVIRKTKLWLFGSPLTRCVLVLKTWIPQDWEQDTEGLDDFDCVLHDKEDGFDSDDSRFSSTSSSLSSAEHTSPTEEIEQQRGEASKGPAGETAADVFSRKTRHCLVSCAAARRTYKNYLDIAPSAKDISETPYITLRAEVWRRVGCPSDEHPNAFKIARDDVRYIIVRGKRVTTTPQPTLEFWRSDFYDPESREDMNVGYSSHS